VSLDVLLIGYNEGNFAQYMESLKASGTDQAAYRDARLAALRVNGREQTSMDLLNATRNAGRGKPLSNADFVWPVITYLGSYLQARNFSWDYVNLFHQQKARLERLLTVQEVTSVVITTTVYVSPQPILEIVAEVRRLSPRTKILVGGPYLADKPRILPRKEVSTLLDLLGADYYIFSSEGEQTLVALLDVLCRQRGSLADVPNLAYRGDGEWSFTQPDTESNSLVETPIDMRLFRREDIGQFASIRTAKSCPFKCSFCGFPGRAGAYTYLPVDMVERELDAIAAIGGISTVTFIDDTFNVPRRRFKEILRMMIRKNYGFLWNSYLRSDHVDDEALELMRESGCEGVFLGVESGSATQLKNMNKTSRPEDYMKVIGKCRELGIVTYASLIIGFPGETESTIAETTAFLDAARPDFFRAQCWYADPYTPVFEDVDLHRIVGHGFVWSHRTMDSREASAWVDQLFCTVGSSVWLPQQGFELWSVFYLQRHGMPLERIKSFLTAFNDAVRHRVLSPHADASAPPELVESIRALAGPGTPPPPSPSRACSVPEVSAGLAHWQSLLEEAPTLAGTWSGYASQLGPGGDWKLSSTELPQATPAAAALSVARAVTRATGSEQALLLAGRSGDPGAYFPLLLSPAADTVQVDLDWEEGLRRAGTADLAARFARDRLGSVTLPEIAVLQVACPDEPPAVATLTEMVAGTLGARVEIAVLLAPGSRLLLAHRKPLSAAETDDLAAELCAVLLEEHTEPPAMDAVPAFDL
jgi:radical SAM PhpK family P-methyltransferase